MNSDKAKLNILGVGISLESKNRVLEKLDLYLEDTGQHFIVTPNPEIILYARDNDKYKKILNKADIALADGFGVKLAGLSFLKNIPRITGADIVRDILKIAEQKSRKVMIINWEKSLSDIKKIENTLAKEFPELQFKAIESEREGGENIVNEINDYSPQIVLVSFGAPYQEMFIHGNLGLLPSVNLALGIGGAFDFLTGSIKRAPALFRFLGLEWFFRIFQEKGGRKLWRLKRIYRATMVFTYEFLKWRILTFKYFNKKV